jgi:hypothetical protein
MVEEQLKAGRQYGGQSINFSTPMRMNAHGDFVFTFNSYVGAPADRTPMLVKAGLLSFLPVRADSPRNYHTQVVDLNDAGVAVGYDEWLEEERIRAKAVKWKDGAISSLSYWANTTQDTALAIDNFENVLTSTHRWGYSPGHIFNAAGVQILELPSGGWNRMNDGWVAASDDVGGIPGVSRYNRALGTTERTPTPGSPYVYPLVALSRNGDIGLLAPNGGGPHSYVMTGQTLTQISNFTMYDLEDGTAVGHGYPVTEGQIWRNGVKTNLQDLLDATVDDWKISSAVDINENGQILAIASRKARDLYDNGPQRIFALVRLDPIPLPAPSQLTLSPTTATGGATVTGTVTLDSPAPGSVVVSLSSNSTSATVPATVTVLSGQTSATFPVATAGVDAVQSATIKATLNAKSASASLRIDPALASYLVFSRSSVAGGTALTGTVFLKGNAGPSGVTVALASSDLALTVPASVAVSAGANSASFPVGTTAVDADTPATVSAKTGAKAVTKAVTVLAATLKSLTLSPTSVTGGAGSKATIALTGPAGPSGLVVALSSSNPAASVPASVSVPAGASSATVTVGTTAVASDTSATVSATAGGKTASAVLGVKAPVLKSLTLGAATVASGGRVALAVSLTGPAPAGGIVVSLSSSHPSLAKLPATTTVLQGATSKTVVFYAGTASAPTQVTLTGAQGGVSKSVVLTVNP